MVDEVFEVALEAATADFGEEFFGCGDGERTEFGGNVEEFLIDAVELVGESGRGKEEIDKADFGVENMERGEEAVGEIFEPRGEVGFSGSGVGFAIDGLEDVVIGLAIGSVIGIENKGTVTVVLIEAEEKGSGGAGGTTVAVGEGVDGGEAEMDNGGDDDRVERELAGADPRDEIPQSGLDLAGRDGGVEDLVGLVLDIDGVLAEFAVASAVEEAMGNDLVKFEDVREGEVGVAGFALGDEIEGVFVVLDFDLGVFFFGEDAVGGDEGADLVGV